MYQFDYEKLSHGFLTFIFYILNIVDNIWESVIFVVKEKE